MATNMSYDKKSKNYPIGFQEWNLEAIESYVLDFENLVKRTMKEGFELATQEKCSAWFPIEYNSLDSDGVFGKEINDPDIIYVELPLGENSDESPRWEFKLSDLIASVIEGHEYVNEKNKPIDPDARPILEAISNHLKSLANVLDMALERK